MSSQNKLIAKYLLSGFDNNTMINQVSLFPTNIKYSQATPNINTKPSNEINERNTKTSDIPAYALKANFLPTFSAKSHKNEDFIEVTDRETGEKVTLKVCGSENYCMKNLYYGNYKVKDGKTTLAFIDIDYEPDTKEDNVGCEVVHLRSLKGDRYKGLGTELLKLAIKKSYEHGKGGNLFLNAEQGYDFASSPYRSNESPIPFYHKFGFKAYSPKDQQQIDRWVETNPNMLPKRVLLYLTDESRDKYLDEMNLI